MQPYNVSHAHTNMMNCQPSAYIKYSKHCCNGLLYQVVYITPQNDKCSEEAMDIQSKKVLVNDMVYLACM